MTGFAVLCYPLLCYTLWFALLCRALICHALLWVVLICFAMFCSSLLCFAMVRCASHPPNSCWRETIEMSPPTSDTWEFLLSASTTQTLPTIHILSQRKHPKSPPIIGISLRMHYSSTQVPSLRATLEGVFTCAFEGFTIGLRIDHNLFECFFKDHGTNLPECWNMCVDVGAYV